MRRIANSAAAIAALLLSSFAHAATFHTREVIHQEMSLYRNIVVSEGDNHRCMTFGRFSGRQSCIQLDAPGKLVLDYTQGLLSALYVQPEPHRILVIGLGGGMLPMALHHVYPQAQIDAVEIDPAVLDVAERYFGFAPNAQVHAYVEDGRMFVRRQGRAGVQYDVIMIDAFDKDYIPEHMLTVEFLTQVSAILAPHGVVASNTFNGPLTPYETSTYQAAFKSVRAVDVTGGNRIILAVRDGHLDLGVMASTARSLDNVLAPTSVSSSLLVPEMKDLPWVTDVHPLTDQFSPANLLLKYEH